MADFGTDNYSSLQDLGQPDSTLVTADNFFTSNEEIDKSQRLQQAKQSKLDRLSKVKQKASFDDSYTDLGDGRLESNHNKVWNSTTGREIQSMKDYLVSERALTRDEQGNVFDKEGNPYTGKTRRIYMFGTNSPGNEVKFGVNKGDTEGAEARYTPDGNLGGYGWKPGEYGVNVDDKRLDVILPYRDATLFEGLVQGREEGLANRAVKDYYGDYEKADQYGSGATEYYTSEEGLFGAAAETDKGLGQQLFNDYYSQVFGASSSSGRPATPEARELELQQLKEKYLNEAADEADLVDRYGNAASAFGASFVNELFVRPVEAVGDLTGWYDIEGTTEDVDNFFGYNPVLEQRAMEEIKTDWNTIMSDDASITDKVRAGVEGAFTALTTPEMLGSSFGVIAAWALPGGVLTKLFGKGTKYVAKLAEINKLEAAGEITAMAARGRKISALKESGAPANALMKQSGHIVAAFGTVNEQYNEFVTNNGGVALEGAEKAKWFANRMFVQTVNQNLDKMVALDIIKSPGLLKSLIPMAKNFTNKEFAALAKQGAKGLAVSSKNAGEEAVQEYTQTMMELYNSRYGSETFKDQDTFKEFLADERNLTEAGVAALAGAGGAGQFEIAGAITPLTGGLVKTVAKTGQAVAEKRAATGEEKTSLEDVEGPTSEEEVKTAKRQYGELLNRVNNDTLQGKVTASNLGTYLDDIDEINRSRHLMENASPEGKKNEEAVYNSVITNLEKLVRENSDTPLTKRIVRKTIQASAQDKADQEATGPTIVEEEQVYDDHTRALDAERVITTLLGSHRTQDDEFISSVLKFAKTNNISEEKFKDIVKSFESVEEEAVRGPRGYKTRLLRLKGLVESTDPKTETVSRELGSIVRMQSAFDEATTQLEGGITSANRKAAELNRQKVTQKKAKPVVTEYVKANGKKFDISIVKRNGKWVALTEEAQKLADTKKRYSKEIRNELRTVGSRSNTVKPGLLPNLGAFVTPTRKKGTKGKRPVKSAKFFASIGKTLANVGAGTDVTKVIVGKKPTADFEAKGAYRRANSLLINDDVYDTDDVVLISDDSFRKSKSGQNFGHDLFSGKEADPEKLTDSQKRFRAALDAGVAFVLDPDMKKDAKAALKARLKKSHGYTILEGYNGLALVKTTAENKAILEEERVRLATEAQDKATKSANKEALIASELALKYKVNQETGKTLDDAETNALKQKIKQLSDIVLEKSFDGDKEKFARFVENRLKKDVKDLAMEQLTAGENATPLNVPDNKGLEVGAKQYITDELNRMENSQQVLADWKKAVEEQQLRGKERESTIKKLLEKVGAVPQYLAEMIKERSFAVGKKDVFEERYTVINKKGKKREVTQIRRKEKSPEEIQRLTTEGETRGGDKYILLDVRKVVQNPFKLVNITKTTVLNSMATAQLPFGIQDNVEKFLKIMPKALKKVEEAELDEQTDMYKEGTTTFKDGNLNLYNSAARGIIFNEDNKPNEQVLAAMYVTLADLMKTDLSKLLRGYKSDADIASMFGIQEYEVTNDMRQHAKKHGTFLKTVANTLGKGVLQQLGFTKTDTSASGEYEALVVDLGNSLIAIGEQAGLLNVTSEKSDKIAQWFKDGEERGTDADTYFVNVTDQEEKVGKYTRKVPTATITAFVKTFEEVIEEFPESSTTRVEYFFSEPSEEQLEKATTTVRNDLFGREVPEAAKTTLTMLMNTGYEANLERIDEFLAAVAIEGSKIKKHLGYIEIGSPEYDNLYAGDKDVQEAKNRAINKTIDELVLLKERLERQHEDGNTDSELFFNYFYASNDRYMMDSNTINPQVDKVVRFLVVPSAHRLTYDVEVREKKGPLFKVDGEDQSYMVRLALTQAFGQGVDKMRAQDVITFGDALLSLTEEQLDVVKAGLLENNKHKIQIEGAETPLTLEAEHITHTLQAIDFLKQVKTGKVDSALSLEFDSLTSGFANKIQQMPILKNMDEHLARTGVLTEEYQRLLAEAQDGRKFDPTTTDSVATVLANGKDVGFYDSYQSLAIKVTDILSGNDPKSSVSDNLSIADTKKGTSGTRVYEAIKSLLPGSDIVETKQNHRGEENGVIDIDSKLRNLFKPPFMTFNYSAGINRITKNLGFEVSDDIAGKIATADFAGEDAALVEVVKEIMKSVGDLYYKEDPNSKVEVPINTPKDLQNALREYPINQIKLKKPFKINNTEKASKQRDKDFSKNLGDVLSEVITLTYGEAVRAVFESEFEAFIKVQDAMNDTYKVAFRIFDQKRMEKLSKLRLEKTDRILTAKDHAKVLEELWDDFPWIVGPLTGSKDKKSIKKDVIAIATTSLRTPSEIEKARANPQTVLGTGYSNATRGVNPLVRYMEEAVSSGSVLPFHAIDGAEIGYLINKLNVAGVAAIHDAVLTPLNKSDEATFRYQEGMQKINAGEDLDVGFSLSKSLGELVERIEASLNDSNFARDFKNTRVKGLKLIETDKNGKVTDDFPKVANQILTKMKTELRNIEAARKEYYGDGGKLTKAWYGNMVGSPASMFQVGMTEPDLSYKKALEDSYSLPTVLENVIEEDNEKVAEGNQTAEQQSVNEVAAAKKDMEEKGCKL